jgi:hypothetical protein
VRREEAALDALARGAGLDPLSIEALAGDVGRRRYFRLTLPENRTAVGVVYPAEEEDSRRRWVAAREHLEGRVRVPTLVADDGRGHQIVEDFGPEDLAARFASHPGERAAWLARAVDAAAVIAGLPDPGINPPFDAALFRRELDLAREAVFELLLGEALSPRDRTTHDEWADALVLEVLGHPFALCHRDYHANNLFPSGDTVAVIDFQDLRAGPDSYDLASLLWERTTLSWMTEGAAAEATVRFATRRGADAGALSSRLSRVLLQRAWKVCGTFARAIARQKGEAYRRYLPGELALVRRLLGASEADRRFEAVLAARCGALC